jgi:uncharacterized membrane protein YdfJ with MMPL/SSD domain
MQQRANLAARIGRWSARHRRTAIAGWLAFIVVVCVAGGMAGTKTLEYAESGVGESGHADRTVFNAFPETASEGVLIQSLSADAGDAQFKTVVADVVRRLDTTPGVQRLEDPYRDEGSISSDGHSALVTYELPGDAEQAKAAVDAPLAAIAAAAAAHPRFRIEPFGEVSSEKQLMEVINGDLHKAELFSLPVTLAILLLAFGGLLIAGVPVLLALSAVFATLGIVGPISQIAPVSDSIGSVVLLIGLAVGVDYALFYVRRVREERAAGRGRDAAIEAAAATSGRAVLISGATVTTAMAGMYLAGAADFASFATGTIVVVLLAMLGSLTVLPALLSAMGDRVDRNGGRLFGRVKARAARVQLWSRIVDRVLRRPKLSVALSVGVLLALAFPTLGMKTADTGPDSLPQDIPAVQTYNRVQDAFPAKNASATLVVEARDVTAAPVTHAIEALEASTRGELFPGTFDVDISPDHTVAQVTIPTAGDGFDADSGRALDALREQLVPAAFGPLAGVTTSVTGPAAMTRDFNASMVDHLPLVFGFVLIAAFVLLLLTFRSIVIPIKAIALNLLSVGAAYGVLVAVFQGEWAEHLLGFNSSGAIVPWLPLFLFVVLFGLSMDYHVFILSRVREAYDRGMSTDDAVAHGIKTTAGVVTSAAAVMVAVFSIFAVLSLLELKQLGVGLAVAVLLDATLIRGVLLPAAMKLLGERNWWLPRSLRWLPKVTPEPVVA